MIDRAPITIAIEAPCATVASEADLQSVVAYALAAEGVTAPVALTVVLVDEETRHELTRQLLTHDEPSDVIACPRDKQENELFLPAEAGGALGEMCDSSERAAAQSAEWGTTPARE